ncbi:hypothetical protein [Nocardioides gilvus]|uniref:hypothetical protein n=1 Tax=Nocardioides gilvus TaxID=1735589 RepID=UPI000D74EB2C|nr:hypothetical protein [Nocardioides gilvus]
MSIDVERSSGHKSDEQYRSARNATAEVTDVPELLSEGYDLPDSEEARGRTPFPRLPTPISIPPFLLRRSGVYRLARPIVLPPQPRVPTPVPTPIPIPPIDLPGAPHAGNGHLAPGTGAAPHPEEDHADAAAVGPVLPPITPLFGTEELRVDVDGVKPTMTVSGTITRLFGGRLTWIARVTQDPATGAWIGPISYRDGTTSLRPQATVSVKLTGGPFLPTNRRATATFSGGTGSTVTYTYGYQKAAFRDVAFEYDTVSDATAVTSHNPTSHPNHAPSSPTSMLTVESAYSRLGFAVTKTGGDSVIPVPPGTAWSDQEMHDAMQAHWSRWADAPQWAMWVLFARLHDMGTSLGGIMFDDIGTAQRQGTAIFSDSFISQAPAGEANPGPWVERMKFWTAMHEIGHGFNLAHSWQKSLGTSWVPLANEPAALSYMNYPYNYPGGLDAFFAAFDYGFSQDELLFLRHAPERLVKMGAAPWFDHHGFEQDAYDHLMAAATGPLELDLRVHREPRFEFLEPVVMELRLKNVSSTPTVVDEHSLEGDGLSIVVARDGGETRRWLPFARYCTAPAPRVLQPGEAMYSSIFVSAGSGGWLVTDPGTYTVYAATEAIPGTGALSKPLRIVVERPASDGAERLAGEVFTQEVAHVLAFGGSRVMESANDTLRELSERLPESRAAVHANAALGAPKANDGKVLIVDDSGQETMAVVPAQPDEANELLSASLDDFDRAADALGHIAVTEQTLRLASVLEDAGDASARSDLLSESADALARRGVLPGVVEELRSH